jgi:hypothetical protein
VDQHSAGAVQAAAAAIGEMAGHYREQGLADAAILETFQSGRATEAFRQTMATPLSEAQLAAVADMVLLPQRRLSRSELVAVIGREAAAGAVSEQAIMEAIGSPVGFGGQTGNVRGVLAGARDLNLSPAELSRLADLISDGLRETANRSWPAAATGRSRCGPSSPISPLCRGHHRAPEHGLAGDCPRQQQVSEENIDENN